jgi:signal transduction histidine kinase
MHAAVRVVRERARGANIALATHIDEYLPAIEADAARLGQVLFNLLSNAIKFTSPGGTIDAEVCRHPEGVAMRIRDTGAGMAPREIPRAIQPFVQVDTSLARRHGGTGLGLPLTKIFVELHGGRLEIESSVNVGTTVTVILPASASGERKQSSAAGSSGPLAESPRTIRPDKIPVRSTAHPLLVTAGGQGGSRETAVV